MADVIVNILQRATSFSFMTPTQARMTLQLPPGESSTSDEYLSLLIETNSDVIATLCNRVFARECVRETWRCLGEPCDCPDARTSRRLFLSHWPVRRDEVLSIQSPRGVELEDGDWELDETAGRISLFGGVTWRNIRYLPWEPIVVEYWGGFRLPDECPPALRYALTILISASRAQAAREQTRMLAGISSVRHKEASVNFRTPEAETATHAPGGGVGTTPAMDSVNNLLSHFCRYWA